MEKKDGPIGKKRGRKLAKIPAVAAINSTGSLLAQLTGQSPDYANTRANEKTAEQIYKILGELKAGATKFGQALSVFEAALPESFSKPYRESLQKLQDSSPPLPYKVLEKVLKKELGGDIGKSFKDIDPTPTASASIGQVHKAIWKDGSAVALKIQYPGVADAMRYDLKQINKLTPILKLILPNMELGPLIRELEERIIEELDYNLEANYQLSCYNAYLNSDFIKVPKVFHHSEKILVTSWLEGKPLKEIINHGSKVERDQAGISLARFHFTAPERARLLHADPHPGNFILLPNNVLGVIDYGACNKLPNGFPKPFKELLANALRRDSVALYNNFIKNNFMQPNQSVEPDQLLEFLLPLVEPLIEDNFKYSREWLLEQSKRVGDPRNPTAKLGMALNLPAEYLLIHRVTLGTTAILAQLEAEGNFRNEAASWFPELI
jgi:predicted unusual protein kinase regulating ubiquinone biosynthesis (AarF/ABC1/UbiB family)